MSFEDVGIRATVQGLNAYLSDVSKMETAVSKYVTSVGRDTRSLTGHFGSVRAPISGLGSAISSVQGQFSSSLAQMGSGISGFASTVHRETANMGRAFDNNMHGAMKRGLPIIGDITNALGKIGLAQFGIQAITGAFQSLTQGLLGGNAAFENYETSFAVLLKGTESFEVGAERAKQRIKELSDFAAKTPFELPEIVQASKLLQTFGGSAIATGETLTMVGDMASSAGVGFAEVAMWVGRAYTNIQAGRPFGEASMRLQELGLMSGEVRQRLEDLQKSGKKGPELWNEFTGSMKTFNGMMDKQAMTMTGLQSTISDTFGQLKREAFAGLFEAVKPQMAKFISVLAAPELHEAVAKIGAEVGKMAAKIFDVFWKLAGVLPAVIDTIKQVILHGLDFGDFMDKGKGPGKMTSLFMSSFGLTQESAEMWAERIQMATLITVTAFAKVGRALLSMGRVFMRVFRVLGRLFKSFVEGPFGSLLLGFKGFNKDSANNVEKWANIVAGAILLLLGVMVTAKIIAFTKAMTDMAFSMVNFPLQAWKDAKKAIEGYTNIWKTLVSGENSVLKKIQQTISTIGEKLIEAGSFVRDVTQKVAKAIGAALLGAGQFIREIFQNVFAPIGKLIEGGRVDREIHQTIKTDEDPKTLGAQLAGKFAGGFATGLGIALAPAFGVAFAAVASFLGISGLALAGVLVLALVAAIATYFLITNWSTVRDAFIEGLLLALGGIGAIAYLIVGGLYTAIKEAIKQLDFLNAWKGIFAEVDWGNLAKDFGKGAKKLFDSFTKAQKEGAKQFITDAKNLPGDMWGAIETAWKALADWKGLLFEIDWGSLWGADGESGVRGLINDIWTFITGAWKEIVDWKGLFTGEIDWGGIAEDLVNSFLEAQRKAWKQLQDDIGIDFDAAAETVKRGFNAVKEAGITAVNDIIDGIRGALGLGGGGGGAPGGAEGQSPVFMSIGMSIVSSLLAGAIAVIPDLLKWFSELPGKIPVAIGEVGGLLVEKGTKLIEGLALGILTPWLGLLTFFGSLGTTIVNALGNVSNILFDKGVSLMGGLLRGMWSILPGPVKDAMMAAGGVVGGIAKGLEDALGSLLPGMAAGGPVTAGKKYIVGEKGPELFAPRQSGTIIPAAITRQMAKLTAITLPKDLLDMISGWVTALNQQGTKARYGTSTAKDALSMLRMNLDGAARVILGRSAELIPPDEAVAALQGVEERLRVLPYLKTRSGRFAPHVFLMHGKRISLPQAAVEMMSNVGVNIMGVIKSLIGARPTAVPNVPGLIGPNTHPNDTPENLPFGTKGFPKGILPKDIMGVKSFGIGGSVDTDMLAWLHAGEFVLSSAAVRALAQVNVPMTTRATAATNVTVAAPISVTVQGMDWAQVRAAIHREIDNELHSARTRASTAGFSVSGGIG